MGMVRAWKRTVERSLDTHVSRKVRGEHGAPGFVVVLLLASLMACNTADARIRESGPGAAVLSASAESDPLLAAMKEELAREKELLLLPGMQRPYFMEYRLEDIRNYEAVANFGALTREGETHQRVVRVQVRIGDYATDSS